MHAKKALGQNFLKHTALVGDIIRAASIAHNDRVLEIGPGKGILTRGLLDRGAKVTAIEKDPDLIALLNDTFKDEIASKQLTLIANDIRTFNLNACGNAGAYTVIANIPYYITGEIIRQLLTANIQPKTIALFVQKEIAERIVRRDKKGSVLAVSVEAYGQAKYVKKVPASSFSPKPKVDSAILLIANISRAFFIQNNIEEAEFFAFVKKGFGNKRKKLSNNLALSEKVLEKCGLISTVRAEEVSLKAWGKLFVEYKRERSALK